MEYCSIVSDLGLSDLELILPSSTSFSNSFLLIKLISCRDSGKLPNYDLAGSGWWWEHRRPMALPLLTFIDPEWLILLQESLSDPDRTDSWCLFANQTPTTTPRADEDWSCSGQHRHWIHHPLNSLYANFVLMSVELCCQELLNEQ